MSKTPLLRQRVSDITPTDVAAFLEMYRSLPAMTLRTDRGVVVRVALSDVVAEQGALGLVAVGDCAWIRIGGTTALGLWVALQAWASTLTAAPADAPRIVDAAKSFPGVGTYAAEMSIERKHMAYEWAVAMGLNAIDVEVASEGLIRAVWPVKVETAERTEAVAFWGPIPTKSAAHFALMRANAAGKR